MGSPELSSIFAGADGAGVLAYNQSNTENMKMGKCMNGEKPGSETQVWSVQ